MDVEREPWGELDAEEEAEEYEEAEADEGDDAETEPDASGLATPAEGCVKTTFVATFQFHSVAFLS